MNEPQSAHAPGRVELLGNHTDYNEGYVLSAAIDRGVTLRGRSQSGRKISLRSIDFDCCVEKDLASLHASGAESWANYSLGVVHCFAEAGFSVGGFSAEITSDLPVGAGLSSSA